LLSLVPPNLELAHTMSALIEGSELSSIGAATSESAWTHEVLGTYIAHLKTGTAERRAFAEAVRVYQARHPNALDDAARRGVATIISHKL